MKGCCQKAVYKQIHAPSRKDQLLRARQLIVSNSQTTSSTSLPINGKQTVGEVESHGIRCASDPGLALKHKLLSTRPEPWKTCTSSYQRPQCPPCVFSGDIRAGTEQGQGLPFLRVPPFSHEGGM